MTLTRTRPRQRNQQVTYCQMRWNGNSIHRIRSIGANCTWRHRRITMTSRGDSGRRRLRGAEKVPARHRGRPCSISGPTRSPSSGLSCLYRRGRRRRRGRKLIRRSRGRRASWRGIVSGSLERCRGRRRRPSGRTLTRSLRWRRASWRGTVRENCAANIFVGLSLSCSRRSARASWWWATSSSAAWSSSASRPSRDAPLTWTCSEWRTGTSAGCGTWRQQWTYFTRTTGRPPRSTSWTVTLHRCRSLQLTLASAGRTGYTSLLIMHRTIGLELGLGVRYSPLVR